MNSNKETIATNNTCAEVILILKKIRLIFAFTVLTLFARIYAIICKVNRKIRGEIFSTFNKLIAFPKDKAERYRCTR